MTYEESYRYWKTRYEAAKDFRDPHWECGEMREHREWCEHMKNAYEALEKQIPEKVISTDYAQPVYDSEGYWADAMMRFKAKCPCCGQMLVDGELEADDCVDIKYCDKCGQALDWSEGEEE